jgi:hypothetical protein
MKILKKILTLNSTNKTLLCIAANHSVFKRIKEQPN